MVASVAVPGACRAAERFWRAVTDMTDRSAPSLNVSPRRIPYTPVTPVSLRSVRSTVASGKAEVRGSTATKTGLSASLIFLVRASAWLAESWSAAAGSTYTGPWRRARATSLIVVALGAAGAMASMAAESISSRQASRVGNSLFRIYRR